MLERNSLLLLLGHLCLLSVNGQHGAYGLYPYGGYPSASAGAYQQQQQAAEVEAYRKSLSSSQSSAGVQQYGLGYGGLGYPSRYPPGFGYYGPVAAAGAYNQQQQSAENEAFSKSKSASQSSAGAGHYGGYVAPAIGYFPLYYAKPFGQSDSDPYTMAVQSIVVGRDLKSGILGNKAGKAAGDGGVQSVFVGGRQEGGTIINSAVGRTKQGVTVKGGILAGHVANSAAGGNQTLTVGTSKTGGKKITGAGGASQEVGVEGKMEGINMQNDATGFANQDAAVRDRVSNSKMINTSGGGFDAGGSTQTIDVGNGK